MEFKTLGSSQVQIPAIGLGTWNYTGGMEPLLAGIVRGASLIDTAEIYGTEEMVGQAIQGIRERVFLATKVRPGNFRRHDLIAAADRSLLRLGTDRIDLYQLHWPNYTVPIAETMAAMEDLADHGKIRFIGVSNFSVRMLRSAEAVLSKHRIVSNQVRYSLIERTIENGLLQYCQQTQITVIAHSPLATGKALTTEADPAGVLARIAKGTGKTRAQVALNWLIGKPHVIAVPKAATIEHTIENCDAAGWRLAQADLDLLERQLRYRATGRTKTVAREWARHLLQLCGRRL